MSDSDKAADGTDPERLLAEALRAQARSAPATGTPTAGAPTAKEPSNGSQAPAEELAADPGPLPAGLDGGPEPAPAVERTTTLSVPPAEQGDQVPAGYGLLSGAGAGSLERERAALDSVPAPAGPPSTARQSPPPQQLSAWWVLLLALVLGLAAGSVVGLLTLL